MLAETARPAPLIVALDDMHWADEASLEILDQVTDGINRLPIQVLVLYRPEWNHPWFHKPYYRHLSLEPLDEAACERLLRTLLRSADLPSEWVALREKTAGNPFFLEEMVKSLQETGVLVSRDGTWTLSRPLVGARLPDTIQRTLLARFDQLPASTQQVLQVASVIGPAFSPALLNEALEHVDPPLDSHLAELEDRGFIYARWDAGDYVFRHALIQEAAHQSLPTAQRRVYHRRIGETLERQDGPQIDVGRLAYHYYYSVMIAVSRDQQLVAEDADPDQLRRAVSYSMQASDLARARYAAREALNYYRRGLTVSQALSGAEEHLIAIHEGMGDAYNILGDFDAAITHLRQALAALHTRPLSRADCQRAADLARRIGRLHGWQGESDTALNWMQEGLRQIGDIEDEEDRSVAALLYVHTGTVHCYQGDLALAAQRCRTGLELAEATGRRAVLAEGYNLLGVIYDTQGQTDEALAHYTRSLEIWQSLGDAYQAARVEDNIGTAHFYRGDWEAAWAYYARCLAFWEQIEDRDNLAYACNNLGSIYLHQGDWEQARASYERALELWEKVQNQRWIAQGHNNLGLLYIEQGAWDQAQAHLEHSRELLLHLDIPDLLPETYRGLAEVALGLGEVNQAVELAGQAVTQATELEMHFEQAVALRTLGRAHAARGQPAQAREHLEASLTILKELQSRYEIGRTLYHLSTLEAGLGDGEKAHEHLRQATAIFEAVGAQKDLERVLAGISSGTHLLQAGP